MRKLLVAVVVVLALGGAAPAPAHADGADLGAVATILRSEQVTTACSYGSDAHCQEHSYHVDAYNIFGQRLWRMTLTLRLGYNPLYCPCIIDRDSVRTTVTPWVSSIYGWEWTGIIDRSHDWCSPRTCYTTYRQGSFHRAYPYPVNSYPWIRMKGYASTRIWDVWSS